MTRLPIFSSAAPRGAAVPLPSLHQLDQLWQDVSQKPLWAPPHFWRFLRLRWRMRLNLLDVRRVSVAAPAGKFNDCANCTDICCVGSTSTVLLRLRDIATLQDLGRTDLISQVKPVFSDAQLAAQPALRRQINSPSWNIFPVLRQDSMHACAALTLEGRCSLYPHWPLACARFPYALHLDDEEIFYSRRCQSFWIHPTGTQKVDAMAVAAVAAYNERIKDMVLLAYAPEQVERLGLSRFLRL